MIVAGTILLLSTALFFFYLQATAQRILRRAFDREYFQTIVTANHLEFPTLRKALEEPTVPVDYAQLRMIIRCDSLTLTYLLKHAANQDQRYSREGRLLILYFRLVFVSLTVRHWLRLGEKPAVLGLVAILQYFANIVGERVNSLRLGDCPSPLTS